MQDHPPDSIQEDNPSLAAQQANHPAAEPQRATIVIGPLIIQSAATPLVGLVMLVIGLMIGYLLRPALPLPAAGPIAAAAPTAIRTALPTVTVASAPSANPNPTAGSPTPNPTEVVQRRQLAAFASSRTRHFKGSANAPVTIVEFSDFQ